MGKTDLFLSKALELIYDHSCYIDSIELETLYWDFIESTPPSDDPPLSLMKFSNEFDSAVSVLGYKKILIRNQNHGVRSRKMYFEKKRDSDVYRFIKKSII